MTPTDEMIAMAERIARGLSENGIYVEARKRMLSDMTGQDIDYHLIVVAGERAALAAIMEVRERSECLQHSQYLVGLKEGWRMCRDEDHAAYAKAMESTEHLAILKVIRNGEHLR